MTADLTICFSAPAMTSTTAALFETPADLRADASARTIVGLALPYGVVGRTSQGPLKVRPGAISVPDDKGRVKLLRDHRPTGEPVGYLSQVTDDTNGMVLGFSVGTGAAGDLALADASQRIRDGLSVELSGIELDASGTEIVKATLDAVALVAIPAFADARVSSVLAAAASTLASPLFASAPTPAGSPAAVWPASTEPAPAELRQAPAPAPTVAAFAAAPFGLTTTAPRPGLSFEEVARTLQAVRAGGSHTELQAALADITRSANPWVSPDGWIGELWAGVQFQREVVPLLSPAPLTHWKMAGWRWLVKPTVDDYAGNKAQIPSNSPTTESVSVEASRLAGGHDIDRKFWDFNDADFIASYFRALTESYAYESDQRAADFVIDSATAVTGPAGTQPDLIRAVAAGVQAIKTGPTRARASYALVNPTDMMGLLDFTSFDVPEYLTLLGIEPASFVSSEFVPVGTVIVGAKSAATFYELGGSPIRVETIDLARGGRDGAVFGYYAALLHNAAGIVSVDIAPVIP